MNGNRSGCGICGRQAALASSGICSWAGSNSSGGLLAAPLENVVGLILRSIKPLDLGAILNSIKKTQRLLLVESGYLAAGAIFTSDSSLRASAVPSHLLALAGVRESTHLSFGPARGRGILFVIGCEPPHQKVDYSKKLSPRPWRVLHGAGTKRTKHQRAHCCQPHSEDVIIMIFKHTVMLSDSTCC